MKRKYQQNNSHLTVDEALAQAETMSDGEAAQMLIAAQLMGLSYDDFLDVLATQHLDKTP